ncbi:hypothetical protein OAO18_08105, partial [Francisellaceae bacterium]|nr:hypothetical protein [Francisellaceae bacterium]
HQDGEILNAMSYYTNGEVEPEKAKAIVSYSNGSNTSYSVYAGNKVFQQSLNTIRIVDVVN